MNSSIIQIVYSAATIQGLFLAWLLVRTRINQPANRILAILLVILSFHLILVGFDNRDFFLAFPHLSRISWIIGTLYWPLLYLFVQFITQTQPVKIYKSLWPLLPFFILLVILLPYYLLSAEEKRVMLSNFEMASQADFGWINQLVSILHLALQVFILAYYIRFERKLLEEYSEVESIRIIWLKQFLVITLAATLLAVISFFAHTWQIPVLSQLYSYHFIGIVLLFYWLSYKALTQPVLFGIVHDRPVELVNTRSESPEKYKKSSLEAAQLNEIFELVKNALEQGKLYTQTDLTLTQLAEATNLPRHQISQAINFSGSGNFFDLINAYRVEEFKRLAILPDKRHLSLLGIAQEAGFNSKASFYAVFKKKTGQTPAEYLETKSKAA